MHILPIKREINLNSCSSPHQPSPPPNMNKSTRKQLPSLQSTYFSGLTFVNNLQFFGPTPQQSTIKIIAKSTIYRKCTAPPHGPELKETRLNCFRVAVNLDYF